MYQLNYSTEASTKWLGKEYGTIDEAIVEGIVTLLEFFENKSNHTKEIFGTDINHYYLNEHIIPTFAVAALDTQYKITPVREINLKDYIRSSENQLVQCKDLGLLTIEELTSRLVGFSYQNCMNALCETELFYSIVSLYPLIQYTKNKEVVETILPELYTSIVMLADKKNIKLNFETQEHAYSESIFRDVGNLAHHLQFNGDITPIIETLLYKLRIIIEVKWSMNLRNLLIMHIADVMMA